MTGEDDGAELLILGGPELGEPIARYGPFVMNTREEIHQAIEDYNNGTLA
jgi:redox-sensitive bicupin YhaK (pirin superfamily)